MKNIKKHDLDNNIVIEMFKKGDIDSFIKYFKDKTNCKIIYITYSGSILYGTDDEYSDKDIKIIYIHNEDDILSRRELLDTYTFKSNEHNINSNSDIDIILFSIHHFFDQLKKGSIEYIDILFSIFRRDTIIYEDNRYIDILRNNYKIFLSNNIYAFIGYCNKQLKIYKVKKEKYIEYNKLYNYLINSECYRLRDCNLEKFIKDFKYIKYCEKSKMLHISNKKYDINIKREYLLDRLGNIISNTSHRIKNEHDSRDYKAVSHMYRVIDEVKELLHHRFITFPLKNRDLLRKIKRGNIDIDKIDSDIEQEIDNIKELYKKSDIGSIDRKNIDKLLIKFIKGEV